MKHQTPRYYRDYTQKNRYPTPYRGAPLSWLEYKRAKRIVRYYPTFAEYLAYKYYALANGFTPYGAEADEEKAHAALLLALRERLQQL